MELTIDQAFQKAVEAQKSGQVHEADRLYTAILKLQPEHPDANHNLGVLAVSIGKLQEALPFLKTALESNQSIDQFWLSYIDVLIKLGRSADASAVLDQAKCTGASGAGFDRLEQRLQKAFKEPPKAQQTRVGLKRQQPNVLESLTVNQAIKLAEKKEKVGNLEEAKHIYQDVLLKFPANKRAKNGLKGLFLVLNASNSKVQDPPQDQVKSLINLYNQGQFEQAINQADTLLNLFPKSAILLNFQGAVRKGLGQLDLSIVSYKKALAIKPDYADAYNNMGVTLQELGKTEEAIEAYRKALAIKLDYAEAYNNIGNAFKVQRKPEEAMDAFKKALAIKPDYADAYYNMGATLQEQERLEEAIDAYGEALAIKPDYADAHHNLGVTLHEQERLEEAVDAYRKALAIKPDYADAYNNMGVTLQELGKLEEAVEAYTKAIAIRPDYAAAYNNIGNAFKVQRKPEEAIDAYGEALAIKPDYADVYHNLGVTLHEQERLEEAIDAYRKALAIKPEYADAYNNMGVTLQELGKLEEAVEAYTKAIAIRPDYTQAHSNLSRITKYKSDTAQIVEVQALLQRNGLNDSDRCNLLYTHAKMQEDLGNLSVAFESYVAAGNLMQKLLAYEFSQDEHLFGKIKQTAPKFKDFAIKVSKPNKHIPIFILGMPRSGTTLVEQIISSHSEVSGAGELDFVRQFGEVLIADPAAPNSETVSIFRERYLAELEKRADGQVFITDKMPQNFLCIALICVALPEAKIIHVKRNPEATCWSNFKHHFASKGLGYSYNLADTIRYYRLYKNLMQYWDQNYCHRIYNLDYDKLTEDQESVTRRLIEYIGLSWEDACLAPQNNKRVVKTASHQQVRQKVYTGSSQAWRKFEPLLDGAFDVLKI